MLLHFRQQKDATEKASGAECEEELEIIDIEHVSCENEANNFIFGALRHLELAPSIYTLSISIIEISRAVFSC